jgi:hypothetical protein
VTAHPSPAERRFATSFFADTSAVGVRAERTQMDPDGRVTSWIWVSAIDTPTMLRLGILIADQLAGGVTDVVLDCADVLVVEKYGLAFLARTGGQLRDVRTHRGRPETHGTLTVEQASTDVVERLTPLVQCGLVTVRACEPAFPSTPHSPEAYSA